jgi:hypothetical protein
MEYAWNKIIESYYSDWFRSIQGDPNLTIFPQIRQHLMIEVKKSDPGRL